MTTRDNYVRGLRAFPWARFQREPRDAKLGDEYARLRNLAGQHDPMFTTWNTHAPALFQVKGMA